MVGHRTPRPRRLAAALLGWSYDRLYDELAWLYDATAWVVSGGRWLAWLRSIYPHLGGDPALEIGSGPGHLLTNLLDRGRDAFGLERSWAMLDRARREPRLRSRGWRLVGGDALALPFAEASFGSLVLTFPAPYVGQEGFWSEAARVLRPGGRLVMLLGAESGAWPWPGPLEWALAKLAASDGKGTDGLDASARRAGFAVERLDRRTEDGRVHLLVATLQRRASGRVVPGDAG